MEVEDAVGIPALFDLAHELVDGVAVDEGYEFAAETAVAVFAAEAAVVFADKECGFVGDLAEELAVAGLFDVEDGAEVEFAGADMAVVDTFESKALHHLLEVVEILWQAFGGDGGVFDDADGFVVSFDTGEDAETGFAERPDTADVGAEDTAAVVGEALVEEFPLEGVGIAFHVVAVEFGYKECGGFALDEETVAVLGAVVAAEFEDFAVHEFDGHGVVA